MKTIRFVWLAGVLAFLNLAAPAKAQLFLDCSCMATQSVLVTNACQAVIPDMCLFTNCIQNTTPPFPYTCSQNPPAGTPVGPGSWTIVVTVSDPFGTSMNCALTFTVNPPAGGPFTFICASNKTVQCNTTWNFDPPTATNVCCPLAGVPGGVVITVQSTVTNGTCPEVITQTWQAQDGCGNHLTCSQKVTVVDTIPPVLTCSCVTNAAVAPVVLTVTNCQGTIPDLCPLARACASDNCGPLTCTQTPLAGTIVGPGVTPITVTVLDCASNSASCTFNFTVVSPVTGPFALLCAPNKAVQCGPTWTFDPPTATNACCSSAGTPGQVTFSVLSTVTNGTCPQVITRTFQGVDACMHVATCSQSVTQIDTTVPTISCAANKTVPCDGTWSFDPPTASDSCSTVAVVVVSTVTNGLCPQVITRTWKATDVCGNFSQCSQVVTVVDTKPPTILCVGNKIVECGTAWNFDPPTASDNCSTVTVAVVSTVTNGSCPQIITRTWSAADVCQNSNTCSQTVTIVDTTPPSLNCSCLTNSAVSVPLTVVACTTNIPSLCAVAMACAMDACGPLTCTQTPPAGTLVTPGVYPITVTLSDCATNQVSCTVNFTVLAPAGGCTPCPPQTNVWRTGMSGNTSLPPGTPDPNFVLVSAPPGGCMGPAQVLLPSSIPSPPWVANGPNSQWIGSGPTADCEPGVYHYRICFNLKCTTGASILGQWAADDNGAIFLNGQPTGNTIPSPQYPNLPSYGWFPVTITNGFLCGNNCLDFYVTNANIGINPTGFRAELTNIFDDCCCTPAQTVFSVFSGHDNNGLLPIGAPDPQFALTCAPPGVSVTTPVAVAPHPLWLITNGPNSQWIGPDPSNNGPGGTYCYTLFFNLPPCTNANPMYVVTGQWMADDAGTIYLNGNPTGITIPPAGTWAFTNWHPFTISSGLLPGLNSLTFYVTNASAGSTGLRLELTATASCCACTNNCTLSLLCPNDFIANICGTNGHVAYTIPSATNSCGLPITGVTCVPPPGIFPLGTNMVTCTATDAAGNTASCSFKVILRPDATPPLLDCTCLQAAIPPRVNACSYTVPNLCLLTSCFSDNCTPTPQLACSQSPPAGTVLPAGSSYIITVTITDAAGNMTQCQLGVSVIAPTTTRVWNTGGTGAQAANFNVIQTPAGAANYPAVLTQPATGYWLPNGPSSSWISFVPNSINAQPGVYVYRLSFTLPCATGASITGRFLSDDSARIWLNGVPTAALSTSYSAWTPVNLTSGFVAGLNVLDVYVTNAIIWTGFRAELTNRFDCCCPQAIALNCPHSVVRGWTCAAGGALVPVPYTVTATSRCPVPGVTVTVNCVPPSPGPFPVGTTIVNCTATDSLGNTTSCSFPVTVGRDTTPPVITCPAPITITTCSNSVRVYYKAPAKDDCSTVTVTCTPPSGSLFNAGTTTTVTCTAVDACGNSSSCSFPVKILGNTIWQTLPAGIADCYSLSGSEPTSPGACTLSAYPGILLKNFDVTTVNRSVAHTWTFPVSWTILAANLATRARPPVNGCAGISGNDSIQLGLNNCVTPAWLWSRYFGSGNASPGLVESQWCNGSGCSFNFYWDLASLPPISGPPINLLPHMNSVKRLDYLAQDDTTVDYANLRVLRCAPTAVFGGFDATLNNAILARGPIGNWCIIPVNPNLPWTSSIALGGAGGVAQPMRYRCKPRDWDVKLNVKARAAGGGESGHAGFDLSHQSNSPVAELRLSMVPPGVTEVEVLLLDDGIVLSSQTMPAGTDVVLASFGDTTEYYGALFTAREGFLNFSRPDSGFGNQLCVQFRPEPDLVPLTSFDLEGTGTDALDLGDPQLRSVAKPDAFTLTGDAIGLTLDGLISVSPLDQAANTPIGVHWSRPANLGAPDGESVALAGTNDLAAYIQVELQKGTPANTNPPKITFTATATFSDMTSRQVPPVIFTGTGYGYGVSSVQDGAPQPIHRVEVWSNATMVVAVPNPTSVECRTLPPIIRPGGSPWFVDADICHRFPYYNREIVRINGVEYQCSELRVSLPSLSSDAAALEGLVALDIQASAVDALILSRVIAGPVPLQFLPPELFNDDVSGEPRVRIGWDQPWPALDHAPTLLGPWTQVPTDGTEIIVPPAQAQRFYQLREQR